jgi:hypothetical protein
MVVSFGEFLVPVKVFGLAGGLASASAFSFFPFKSFPGIRICKAANEKVST